jgi:hypothetical protein
MGTTPSFVTMSHRTLRPTLQRMKRFMFTLLAAALAAAFGPPAGSTATARHAHNTHTQEMPQ